MYNEEFISFNCTGMYNCWTLGISYKFRNQILVLCNIYYCYKTRCHARNVHQYMHVYQISPEALVLNPYLANSKQGLQSIKQHVTDCTLCVSLELQFALSFHNMVHKHFRNLSLIQKLKSNRVNKNIP